MDILDKVSSRIAGKTIKSAEKNDSGIVITFDDDTRLKLKSPQFYEAASEEPERGTVVDFPFKRRTGRELVQTELYSIVLNQVGSFGPEALQTMHDMILVEMNQRGINPRDNGNDAA
jgi:hypothetical protein